MDQSAHGEAKRSTDTNIFSTYFIVSECSLPCSRQPAVFSIIRKWDSTHAVPYSFLNVNFSNILPPTSRYLRFIFPRHTLRACLIAVMRPTDSVHLILFQFINLSKP